MKILITGASGLIGGRLIERLGATGEHEIRAASRSPREWPSGVEGIVLDYERPSTFVDATRDIDAVVNLASMGERDARANPVAALRSNVGGTLALSTAAAQAGVAKFVQMSTFKVYGNTPTGRITEESPTRPQSHYSLTHRASEDYASLLNANTVVLRLANGFGAPVGNEVDCWGIIVNGMCRQALVEQRIGIMSSGRSWRNFVPMDDVTAAIEAAATRLAAGTYQVASSQAMRLVDMAHRVASICSAYYGFTPIITTGSSEGEVEETPLDYRDDKLVTAGMGSTGNYDHEIERTLVRARELFAPA